MKKLYTLIAAGLAFVSVQAQNQCTASYNYDLIVTGNMSVNNSSPTFVAAYICSNATLTDSSNCCTKFICIESGATYSVGQYAYGGVYIKSGGTFNANNNFMNWMVYAEPGAVINNPGSQTIITNCSSVVFNSANCATGITENGTISVKTFQDENAMIFRFGQVVHNAEIEVFGTDGKLAGTSEIFETGELRFATQQLAAGIYQYRIREGNTVLNSGRFAVVR